MSQHAASLNRIIISTSSLDRALALYRDVLGYAGSATGGTAMLQAPSGAAIMLHERTATPSDTAVAPAFAVTDVDRVTQDWQAAGGTVVDPPEDRPWGERMAVVRDADGHLVCLVS